MRFQSAGCWLKKERGNIFTLRNGLYTLSNINYRSYMQGRLIFIYEWGLSVSCNYLVPFWGHFYSSVFSILSHIHPLFFLSYQYRSEHFWAAHHSGHTVPKRAETDGKVEFQPLQIRMCIHLIIIIITN